MLASDFLFFSFSIDYQKILTGVVFGLHRGDSEHKKQVIVEHLGWASFIFFSFFFL